METPHWYAFDTDRLNEMFTGGLTYMSTFCLTGESSATAVYHVAKPDRSKDHKDFLLLSPSPYLSPSWIVRGMSWDEMSKHRYQWGGKCSNCNDIIYSRDRHDCRPCECGQCFLDGGKDYVRSSGNLKPVWLDALLGEEIPEPPELK